MTNQIAGVLMGAVAMASFVAMLFFLRFWRQTRDGFFLLFAVAFGIDAASRLMLGLSHLSDETEPLFYVSRLVTFCLIIAAIAQKNKTGETTTVEWLDRTFRRRTPSIEAIRRRA